MPLPPSSAESGGSGGIMTRAADFLLIGEADQFQAEGLGHGDLEHLHEDHAGKSPGHKCAQRMHDIRPRTHGHQAR